MDDGRVYVLVSACLIISLISVGFAGFTYYNRASRSKTNDTSTNKPIPPDLNKTYWDNWRRADSVSDYQRILDQASRYEHNPSSWHSPPSVSIGQGFGVGPYDYVVFQGSADNYYAKSGDNGQIMYEGSDASTVVQNAVDSLSKGTVYLKGFDRPSGVTTTENVSIIAENLGDMTIDNSVWNFNSVNAEQLFNAGISPKRPLFLNSSKTVTVDPNGGADYTSLQTAINNELPYILHAELTFDLADGTYNENVTVPVTLGGSDTYIGITIIGNTTTPSNVNGLSFATNVVDTPLQLVGLQIDREHPFQSENAGVIAWHSKDVILKNVVYGNITKGVVGYGSYVEIVEVDFGSNLTTAVEVKDDGRVKFQAVGATNIVGTTSGTAMNAQNGVIEFHSNSSLSGSPTADRGQGFVFDETGKVLAGPNEFEQVAARKLGAQLTLSADQSIPSATSTTVAFDNADFEDTDIVDADLTTGKVTVQKDGKYLVSGSVHWASSADWTAGDASQLKLVTPAGVQFVDDTQKQTTYREIRSIPSHILDLAAGDTVSLEVYQDSGATENILADPRSKFTIYRIGT